MNNFGKTIFLTLALVIALALALKATSYYFLRAAVFLLATFVVSMSAGAQSFMLARLPFIFITGLVFFLLLLQGGAAGNLFLGVSSIAIASVVMAMSRFSHLYKLLPNISRENYGKFAPKYRNSRNIILALLYIAAFAWYADAFILYSLLGYSISLTLIMVFFATLLLTSFIIKIYSASRKERKNAVSLPIYSWITGLVISQISWVVGFWPFGYLTVALIVTIIYYTTSMILKDYLFGRLEKRSVMRELIFASLMIVITFYFTRWLPL